MSTDFYSINNLPKDPVSYPVGPVSKNETEKAASSKKIAPGILKTITKKHSSKSISWNKKNTVRAVKKDDSSTEAKVETDKELIEFLKKEKAFDPSKEGGDTAPTGKYSNDPEDVKEISEFRKGNLRKKDLIKYRDRLESKLKHVFVNRSEAFQDDIKYYLEKFNKAIKNYK